MSDVQRMGGGVRVSRPGLRPSLLQLPEPSVRAAPALANVLSVVTTGQMRFAYVVYTEPYRNPFVLNFFVCGIFHATVYVLQITENYTVGK